MFSFSMVHLILSMGIFIIKHYITEVEKQNKFSEKRQYVFYVKAIMFLFFQSQMMVESVALLISTSLEMAKHCCYLKSHSDPESDFR